jgi:hypothetical protein
MRRFFAFWQKHEFLLVLLVILVLLRIPNLFEPYWYGDEAIYLTLGQGMRHGLTLYKEIIDHKTPLIYVFAMVGTEFWFKFLFLGWMIAATSFFYSICLRLFKSMPRTVIATGTFIALSTLPWFEGHIANGELFVIGFVLAGVALFVRSSLFTIFEDHQKHKSFHVEPLRMFAVGALVSLGVLTKVPAIFDIAALAVVYGFVLLNSFSWKNLRALIASGIMLWIGIFTPILLSVLYFALKQSLPEYLAFGLLYNFKYTQEFSVPISQPILQFLYTMPGKLAVLGSISLLTVILQKYTRPAFRFVFLWFMLTLFSSLLSSRPYPHYFLQMIPPFALLVSLFLWPKRLAEKAFTTLGLTCAIATMFLLHVGLYSISDYYGNFWYFATKQVSAQEYRQRFNPLMDDTYALAEEIRSTTMPSDRIFIWGTNPMLYALSRRSPAGRFTVSFHIKDFDAYEETMRSIEKTQPPVIVIMSDEDGAFPAFYAYLAKYYVNGTKLPTMSTYRRAVWK